MANTTDPTKLDRSSVSVRLGLCLAAVGGTAAVPTEADASVVTFVVSVPIPQTTQGVYINFLTGATGAPGATVPGWDFNPYLSNAGTQLGFYWAPTPDNGAHSGGVGITPPAPAASQYLDLAPGSVISSASTFIRAINATTGTPFRATTGAHTLGFRFFNETTGADNFGYLTVTTTTGTGYPAEITAWSYEDSGGSITVPGVPEPSTSLLAGAMAFGALGMRRWRRQQRSAA